jgi:ABC-2 type transport system permease protein
LGQILSAKLLALIFIILLTLLPSLLFVQSVAVFGFPKSNFDSSLILGGYIALFLLILCFVGFGVLASSLTKKQPVAFILGLVLNFVFWQGARELGIDSLDLYSHYNRMSMGLLSFGDLVFFLGFFLLLMASIRIRLRLII